ncbi:hypothetical protein GOP47_0010423 [Adiantum capillus-veneris]|uniref:Uncharacterized protein n=1 Tax=Adiantum capillus-veneris TaxID=13818 RepID=A0A9D4UV94_ADICA|nr:hypothetical protein GOP47_0010423 [Adiantum capillus-veneris]
MIASKDDCNVLSAVEGDEQRRWKATAYKSGYLTSNRAQLQYNAERCWMNLATPFHITNRLVAAMMLCVHRSAFVEGKQVHDYINPKSRSLYMDYHD